MTPKPYLDKAGYQLRPYRTTSTDIRAAERWIRRILARGATIPEAVWDLTCIFSVAVENVRAGLVRRRPMNRRRQVARRRD
jgi:hypothetical protein